jgi:hypothetical protein
MEDFKMKNIIIALLIALQVTSGAEASAIVDRIEDNNIAVVEISYGREIKFIDIPMENFNRELKHNQVIDFNVVYGKFHNTIEVVCNGKNETMHQFRSYDNSVWWLLTEEDIGSIPNNGNYALMYCDNGTTAENKTCGCPPEWKCECEVYDDIFLGIFEKSNGNFENIYPKTMKVEEINIMENLVTLIDGNGFEWKFQGVEDWKVGDICACTMYDNNTETIFDDEIIDIKYSGRF